MICPQCQCENRDGAKFCNECGVRLVDTESVPSVASESAEPQAPENSLPKEPAFLDALGLPDLETFSNQDTHEIPVLSELDVAGVEPDSSLPSESIDEDSSLSEDESTASDGFNEGDEADCPKTSDDLQDINQDEVTPSDDTCDSSAACPNESENESGNDFSGLEFAGFKPEGSAYSSEAGDTLEMPAIGKGIGGAKQTNFVAPTDAKAAKRAAKEQKKKAKQAKKEAERAAKSGTLSSEQKRSGKRTALIAVLSCVVLALVAGACVFGSYQLEMWGGKSVPDVAGMTQTDATYLLQSKGFAVRATQVASDDTEGLVLLADPSSGTREPEGTEVVIHVAVARTIPSVVGMQRDEAMHALDTAGYDKVEIVTQKSNEVEGKVLSVSPTEGEKAKSTQTVTITVTEAYKVPDVSGTTWEDAKAKIENEGLNAYYTEEYNESATAGTVLYTVPEIGSKVDSGSTVTVVIAKSRAYELSSLTRQVLPGMQLTLNDGSSYTISNVVAVSYSGNDTCAFTATGTVSKDVQLGSASATVTAESTETGAITFNADNSVASCIIHSS